MVPAKICVAKIVHLNLYQKPLKVSNINLPKQFIIKQIGDALSDVEMICLH